MKTASEVRQQAEEHWDWLETLLRKVFIDAFIHGYKHSREEKDEDSK